MTSPSTRDLLDRGWRDILVYLPRDIDALAVSTGAIQKRREIRTGAQLLRLAFGYAVLNLSLRSTSAWAKNQGLAEMSDVAILNRLTSAVPFLQAVLARVLALRVSLPPVAPLPFRIRLTDGTTLSHPGSKGTDWRVHASYDAGRGVFDAIEVTDGKGGEHLMRVAPKEGDLVVADRGYAHAHRIIEARAAGAHVLVRVGHSAVPMWTPAGIRFDPLAHAQRKGRSAGRPWRVEEAPVELRGDDGQTCTARLIIVRKSAEATRLERERIQKEASRKGKQPTARTLTAAAFTYVAAALATLLNIMRWFRLLRF